MKTSRKTELGKRLILRLIFLFLIFFVPTISFAYINWPFVPAGTDGYALIASSTAPSGADFRLVISGLATTTGNLIVGSSTASGGWIALAVGTNGQLLQASSTAPNGVTWTTAGTGITSLNSLTGATQLFTATTTASGLNIDSSGTTHAFWIATSTASQAGFLSSADWTTFNNKVAATRAINTAGALLGGGDLSADRTLSFGGTFATSGTAGVLTIASSSGNLWTFNLATSTASQNGYLSSADWTIFNNKQSAITLSGTSGQVHIASSSGTWTFTLPQTIWPTSTVDFATLNAPTTLNATGTIRIPNAAGCTTLSAAGHLCVDSSTSTVNFHDGTAERVLSPIKDFTLTVPAPTSTDADYITNNITIKHFDAAFTITKVSCVHAQAGQSVTFNPLHSTDRSTAGTALFSASQSCTNSTSSDEYTTFSDATLAADEMLWVDFTAASSTQASITFFGRFDP